MSELEERVAASKTWFEKLVEHVPGYRGYKSKELRRETDRIHRAYLAERLNGLRQSLSDLIDRLSKLGKIELLGRVDEIARRIRTISDRVEYADYGYSGWFDAVKIKEEELLQLYQFDLNLLELVTELERVSETLVADSPSLAVDLDLLEQKLKALEASLRERENLLTGAGR